MLISKMTLREKVYQTVIQRSENYVYDDESAKTQLKDKPFGGFFVGAEVIGGKAMQGDDVVRAITRAKEYSKIPPIICADTEHGCGYMFPDGRYSQFPMQMALGATGTVDFAYDWGKYTAIPAAEIGVNLSLGPVADLNMNFLNPVMNTRVVSDDADFTKETLVRMIKGMQEHGLGATAKHFPGDGVDYRDQHFVLTSNTLSVEEWRKTFGAVYKDLIDNGLLCVMAGHISFPAYQKERIDEIAPPATLSKELITDLLKGELGFKYAVMSDALWMNGFRTTYCNQLKSEIECFKAGIDLLLWPTEEYPEALVKAVETGEIPLSRLDDAVERILLLKYELGLFGDKQFKTDSMDGVFEMDEKISEAAMTLIRNRKNLVPCPNKKHIAIIGITDYDDEIESLHFFQDELSRNGATVDVYKDECDEQRISEYDLFIYCTFRYPHKPQGYLQLVPSWQTSTLTKENSIVVAFGSPYLLNANFPTVNTAIAAYSNTEQCMRSVAKGILGKLPFKGKCPVKLQEIQ